MQYAECFIDTPIPSTSTFTYKIPADLVGKIYIGSVVLVPLKSRRVKGLVVGLSESSGHEAREIISSAGRLPRHLLDTVRFIADKSITPIPQVLKAILPRVPVRTSPIEPMKLVKKKGIFSKKLLYGPSRLKDIKKELRTVKGERLVIVPRLNLIKASAEALGIAKYETYHAELALKAKNRIWQEVEQGKTTTVVGTRSALFLPFSDLSLIVADKEEDFSYTSEMKPYISYVDVAWKVAELTGARLILSALSPRVETFHRFEPHEITGSHRKVDFEVIKSSERDLIYTTTRFEKTDLPALIYVGRRGAAAARICVKCGSATKCSECGTAMVLHKSGGNSALVCHHCNKRLKPETPCPVCGAHEFYYIGTGSERFESNIKKQLAAYKVIRVDKDSPHLDTTADVVIATKQILYISPGILFKKIIVPLADLPLSFPDFRSSERFYSEIQELKERLLNGGRIVFETGNPEDDIFELAASGNYKRLFNEELLRRQQVGWPPLTHLIKISRRDELDRLTESLTELKSRLAALLQSEKGAEIVGPTPSLIPKERGKFVGFITIKLRQDVSQRLREDLLALPRGFKIETDPLYLV